MMTSNRFFLSVFPLAALLTTACSGGPTSPTSVATSSGPAASVAAATSGAVQPQRFGSPVQPAGGGTGGGGTTQPDVQLTGSSSTSTPAPGATYSYTFQAKNIGTAVSPAVLFFTVLPMELAPASFQSVTNSDGSACTSQPVDSQVYIACPLGDLAVGAQETITIVVSAPVTPGTFGTQATAYPFDAATNPLADKNLGDNDKTVKVTVR